MKIYKHLRGLVKQLLARAGFNYEPNGTLPRATIELIDIVILIMNEQEVAFDSVVLLQIGASDGYTHDFVNPFVRQYNIRSYFLEPMPNQFKKLCATYKDMHRSKCINAAISGTSGYCTMYRVNPDGDMKSSYFVDTLASLDYKHLVKHKIPAREIQEIRVPCFTLDTLYQQERIDKVDILVVDAEGFDAAIISSAISLTIQPKYIIFENIHISMAEKKLLYAKLDSAGYRYIHGFRDTLAVKEKFFDNSLAHVAFT